MGNIVEMAWKKEKNLIFLFEHDLIINSQVLVFFIISQIPII
jgi:hypothetical protein